MSNLTKKINFRPFELTNFSKPSFFWDSPVNLGISQKYQNAHSYSKRIPASQPASQLQFAAATLPKGQESTRPNYRATTLSEDTFLHKTKNALAPSILTQSS